METQAAAVTPQRNRSGHKWLVLYNDSDGALFEKECVDKGEAEAFINDLGDSYVVRAVHHVVKSIVPRVIKKL